MYNPLLQASGLPKFSEIRAAHVEPALRKTLEQNRADLESILGANGEPSFSDSILPLEELRDRLHRTWAPVSHLHGVLTSSELRDAYNICLPLLARYETEMAQDRRLFALYQKVSAGLEGTANGPEQNLLDHALRDFRLAGVDLPAEKKARFKAVIEELTQLQAKFEQNLRDAMAAWSWHETRRERLAGIPETVLASAAEAASAEGKQGWLLHLNQPTYVAVITHAENRDLRFEFYRAWATRASDEGPNLGQFDNSETMDRILALRAEEAALVGYENFAAYSLATKMAGSGEEVRGFLQQLLDESRSIACSELADLEQFAGIELEAWDIDYYSEKLRHDRFSISDEDLRPYFPLSKVLEGLFFATNKLFGITAERDNNVDTWRSDVQFFKLLDANGSEIGAFFLDLFTHQNKRAGAWMDECIIRKHIGDRLQTPVAHLVCNFTLPTNDAPALLTHDEVVTLFHEFGHTLHHLLTRMDYPSVSGINGVPWDAVELPSQFMENFAWDPRVVIALSSHHVTGEALPEELLERLQESRTFQAGMQMLRQLEFALFDWRIHAEYSDETGGRISEILEEVREQVAVVRYPPFNRLAHGFAHVFGGGYAAGYYSYKWAEVLAADAFAAFEGDDLFNPDVATAFRQQILEVGGGTDISEAYRAFRGRAPDVEALLVRSGIHSPPDVQSAT